MRLFQFCKLMSLSLLAVLSSNMLSAQVTNTQGFELNTFVPAGWTLSTTNGNNLWSRRTTGTFPTCTPHSGTAMARFNSHTAAAGRTQAIITPAIDYSALGNNIATFSLWVYRDTGAVNAADSLTISVNTVALDSGSTTIGTIARNININLPNTEAASGWYQYTFNVPSSFNTNTNYIIINGTAEAGNSIYIDDVSWISYPTPCTGTPSAGTVSSNPGIICGGTGSATLALTGATTGYSGISYQWQSSTSSTGPWTTFDSVAATRTGTITTTTYYRCYLTCSFSGIADTTAVYTALVTNSTAPVVTVTPGNVNYCAGSTPPTLTASGAATYSWSPATGLNTTLDSQVTAAPGSTTRYTVTGTDLSGCSGTAQATVNVRPAPVLTVTASPDTVCAGDSVTLTASTTGFVNPAVYTWSPDSIVGASVKVAPATVTLYKVVLTSNGCPATDSIWVYANPASIAAFGYSSNGHSISFQDSSSNATTWNWSFGDGNTSVSQNPVYTYSNDGIDTVTLITTGFCSKPDTTTKVITVYALGINNVAMNSAISVYPNPAENIALVNFNAGGAETKLTVYNALGELVKSFDLTTTLGNNYQQRLDLSNVAPGVYMIRVTNGNQNISQHLIKQ